MKLFRIPDPDYEGFTDPDLVLVNLDRLDRVEVFSEADSSGGPLRYWVEGYIGNRRYVLAETGSAEEIEDFLRLRLDYHGHLPQS